MSEIKRKDCITLVSERNRLRNELTIDRDQWKARAEKAERLNKTYWQAIRMRQPCYACQLKRQCSGTDKLDCEDHDWRLFLFDAARFAGGDSGC